MRYGKPSMRDALNDLRDLGVNQLLVLAIISSILPQQQTGSIFESVTSLDYKLGAGSLSFV